MKILETAKLVKSDDSTEFNNKLGFTIESFKKIGLIVELETNVALESNHSTYTGFGTKPTVVAAVLVLGYREIKEEV